VDEISATIDLEDAASRITSRTKAIIPVHLYGQPADLTAVEAFASRHNLVVIEDNAQSVGARWNGKCLGAFGQTGCFSFYPGKNLGAAGEAGMVTTNDDAVAEHIKKLRNHGQRERYIHEEIGYNYRMDGLQAVVLRHKLKQLDRWTSCRKELAKRLQAGLEGLPLDIPLIKNQDHVWHLFVVRTQLRDALREHLAEKHIETGLHYPVPCHRQPCLRHLATNRSSFPQSDRWANEGLSLPLFYGMSDQQMDHLISGVRSFFKH
jgi:dTDP-4-amino-4,6-dideoxygalactose transaminase